MLPHDGRGVGGGEVSAPLLEEEWVDSCLIAQERKIVFVVVVVVSLVGGGGRGKKNSTLSFSLPLPLSPPPSLSLSLSLSLPSALSLSLALTVSRRGCCGGGSAASAAQLAREGAKGSVCRAAHCAPGPAAGTGFQVATSRLLFGLLLLLLAAAQDQLGHVAQGQHVRTGRGRADERRGTARRRRRRQGDRERRSRAPQVPAAASGPGARLRRRA